MVFRYFFSLLAIIFLQFLNTAQQGYFHKPAASKSDIDKYYESQFPPEVFQLSEQMMVAPSARIAVSQKKANYYDQFGISEADALKLQQYLLTKATQKKTESCFSPIFKAIRTIAKDSGQSISQVIDDYTKGKITLPNESILTSDSTSKRPVNVQTKPVAHVQKQPVGNANMQQKAPQQLQVPVSGLNSQVAVGTKIGIGSKQPVPISRMQSTIPKKPVSASHQLASGSSKVLSGASNVGIVSSQSVRPKDSVWTRSFLHYVPVGDTNLEKMADQVVHNAAGGLAVGTANMLSSVSLRSEPEIIQTNMGRIRNPNAGKKYTLLNAVDDILANPIVRSVLEITIIGPLDIQNKDLKMRQFVMIVLVTYYNKFKMILSPYGALDMAVSHFMVPFKVAKALVPEQAALIVHKVVVHGVSIFGQYLINGGNLGLAIANQAQSWFTGYISSKLLKNKNYQKKDEQNKEEQNKEKQNKEKQ